MSTPQKRNDRRETPDEADRRIIDRFSEPRISNHFKQISLFVKILAFFFVVISLHAIYETVFIHLSIGLGVFKFGTYVFTAALLFKFNRALNNFLENESINHLAIVIERQMTLWLMTAMTIFITFVWSIL